ncbi:MAG: hypothetical protein ABL921_09715 [Pirellula sp.]
MRFKILDLLLVSGGVAVLLSLQQIHFDWFVVFFALLNTLQVIIPFAILILTISIADQKGPMLDVASLPGWTYIKKFWQISFAVTMSIWFIMFLVPQKYF